MEQLRQPGTNLIVVCRGISKLLVVDVALVRDQDNPQLIFESMNSTGRELSQADLIRNFVLMGQPPELRERLYTLHWRPKGLARNVAGMRPWGNGEVELGVATLEEVPYALGLIRQALERQLDDATGSP